MNLNALTDNNTAAKTPFKLLSCNNPNRPCWGFFRDIFTNADGSIDACAKNLLSVPADEGAARDRLRHLLVLAHVNKAQKLVRFAFFGKTGKGKQIRGLAAVFRETGTDLECYSPRDGGEDGLSDPTMRSTVNFVISRLWCASDRAVTAVNPVYAALGTSSKEPTRCWLPEKAGVIPHLRAHLGFIVKNYLSEVSKRSGRNEIEFDDNARNLMEIESSCDDPAEALMAKEEAELAATL